MKRMASIRVQRGGPDQSPTFDDFEVPCHDGMSVLDALIWIRAHADETLAIRYSCTNANTCKECMVKVEGKVVYACTERICKSTLIVEPLTNKRLVRDLVTDIAPPKEKLFNLLSCPSTSC